VRVTHFRGASDIIIETNPRFSAILLCHQVPPQGGARALTIYANLGFGTPACIAHLRAYRQSRGRLPAERAETTQLTLSQATMAGLAHYVQVCRTLQILREQKKNASSPTTGSNNRSRSS